MDNKPDAAPEAAPAAPEAKPPRRMTLLHFLRLATVTLLYTAVGVGVFWLSYLFSAEMDTVERWIAVVSATFIGVMVSMILLSPLMSWAATTLGHTLNRFFKMPLPDICSTVFGLIVGLVIASLLNSVVGKALSDDTLAADVRVYRRGGGLSQAGGVHRPVQLALRPRRGGRRRRTAGHRA